MTFLGYREGMANGLHVMERVGNSTIVKLKGVDKIGRVSVMSGEVVERTLDSLTLKLRRNDSLLINGRIVLWWNEEEKCFVRQ